MSWDCAGYCIPCGVKLTRLVLRFSSNTICLWAISSPPGAMTGYSATDTGFLMMRRTSYGPFTMSQAGSSMPSAKAANSIMGRVRTDPPRSCGSLTRCLRSRAADTPAPDAGRLAVLALEAAVEGLLGVKAEGYRHVQDRLVVVG